MPDYQKGKIYKLVSDHTDEIYIGSTIQKLSQRLSKHACDFRKGNNGCTCKKLFDLGDVKIVLIENVPCNSKEELYKRERHYIETTNCVNKYIPGRTNAENYQDKKEEISKQKKEYYIKNNDKIKEYYLKNKEEISKKIKEYNLKNKEDISKKMKEYRLKNKDKIKEYTKERNKVKITCDCGADINKNSIYRHKRSNKHMDLMESKTPQPVHANPL